MKYFKSQTANAQLEDFFEHLKNVSDDKLNEYISEARNIGISEDQINQGLKLIKQIKKSH